MIIFEISLQPITTNERLINYFRLNKLITKAVLDLLILRSIKIRNIDRRQIKTNSYTDKAQEIQPQLVGTSCYL